MKNFSKKLIWIVFLNIASCLTSLSFSQHDQHQHKSEEASKKQNDTTRMDSMMNHNGHHGMEMSHSLSRNLPMQRNGSGTSWHPDNSPMYMNMFHARNWMLMLHYGVFGVFSAQNFNNEEKHVKRAHNLDRRGGTELNAASWVMLMANRSVGTNGIFSIRGMFSADPVIQGGDGYPLLLQSGETWKGEPLVDRQHPHDLISELAVSYSHALSKEADVYGYFGYPGEPAIGPPAFMHRPSALNIPSSPLSHHWQDATHIIFGVGTLGFRYKNVRLEGSIFTGREPDEDRYNFDRARFDSYSARISFMPAPPVVLHVSYGFLKSPEFLEPEKDVNQFSASLLHNISFGNKVLSSAFIWGLKNQIDPGHPHNNNSHSFVLESSLQGQRINYFTRMEYVQKSNHELDIENTDDDFLNKIGSIGIGASVYILKTRSIWLDLGVIGYSGIINKELKPVYGNNPLSAEVFLRLIPSRK